MLSIAIGMWGATAFIASTTGPFETTGNVPLDQSRIRALIWLFYRSLKAWRRTHPQRARRPYRPASIASSATAQASPLSTASWAPVRQQKRIAEGARTTRHSAPYQRLRKRHPLQVTKRGIRGGTAAMRAATVATPFSRSSRPAPRTASNSGIIWAHASPSPDARIFPTSHKSSARSLLRHHDRQDFCPVTAVKGVSAWGPNADR